MTEHQATFADDPGFLRPISEQEVAHRWQKSVRTLQRWRREGYGPAYLRIGGTIRYRLSDVLAFEASICIDGKEGK